MFLFLPVTGYFWLRVTSPASVNSNKWSLRLLIGVFMLSIIGLYSYWLAVMYQKSEPGKTEVSQTPTNIKELLAQSLQKIDSLEKQNDELSTKIDLLADGQKDVLAKNDQSEEEKIDTGLPLGYLTLTSDKNIKSTEVYSEPSSLSAVAGIIEVGKTYPYFDAKNSWYQIELDNLKKVWVQSVFVSVKEQ